MGVFWALLWRELKRGRTTYHIISYILPPTLYVLVYGLTMTRAIAEIQYRGALVDYLRFVTPGIIALTTLEFERSFAETRLDVATRMFVMLLASNMKAHHYIASRIVSYAAALIAQIAYMVALTGLLTGYWPTPSGVGLILAAGMLSLILWISIGVLFGLYITSELVRDIVFVVLGLPIRLFSNAYYPLEAMPEPIQLISLLNPLTYAGSVIRDAYLRMPVRADMMLALTAVSVTSLAVALHKLSKYRVK